MADRHQFRADWHDYNGGIYFVTICCANKCHLFGEIISDTAVGTRFIASALGRIVQEDIQKLPSYHNDLEILNYVIMPNHIHAVFSIAHTQSKQPATSNRGCLKPPRHEEPVNDFHHNSRLATIVGAFKAGVTRKARKVGTRFIASTHPRFIASTQQDEKIWQSRYHEHIIRNQRAFDNIMNYIDSNVENWCYDRFNHDHIDNADARLNNLNQLYDADARLNNLNESYDADARLNNLNESYDADAMNRVPTKFDNHEA